MPTSLHLSSFFSFFLVWWFLLCPISRKVNREILLFPFSRLSLLFLVSFTLRRRCKQRARNQKERFLRASFHTQPINVVMPCDILTKTDKGVKDHRGGVERKTFVSKENRSDRETVGKQRNRSNRVAANSIQYKAQTAASFTLLRLESVCPSTCSCAFVFITQPFVSSFSNTPRCGDCV